MKIRNAQKEAHPSSITPEQLGKALSKIDLDAIPPEKRKAAIMDALATIMAETIHDPEVRAQVRAAQVMHRRKHNVL